MFPLEKLEKINKIITKMEELSRLRFEIIIIRKSENSPDKAYQVRPVGTAIQLNREEATCLVTDARNGIERIVECRVKDLLMIVSQNLYLMAECVDDDLDHYISDNCRIMSSIYEMKGTPIRLSNGIDVISDPSWCMRFDESEKKEAESALESLNECIDIRKREIVERLSTQCLNILQDKQ